MSKTRNTHLIVFSILLIPLTVFWLCNYLHNNSSLLEKLYHDDLQQVVQAIFSPKPEGHEHFDRSVVAEVYNPNLHDIKQPGINAKDYEVVVTLTGKNFSRYIAENKYVMVDFYAPWWYWSQKLAPDYKAAAATLRKGDGVAFAKVAADTERELARKYGIYVYPTLLWFAGGIPKSYYGDREKGSLLRWVRTNIAGVPTITNKYEAQHLLATDFMKVVGFYNTLEGPDSKELFVASELRPYIRFYQTTSPEVAKIFHIDPEIKHPVLVQLRKVDEDYRQFVGSFTGWEIASFLSSDLPHHAEAKAPVVSQYDGKESSETEVLDWSFSPKYNFKGDSFRLGTSLDDLAPASFGKGGPDKGRSDSFSLGTGSNSFSPTSFPYVGVVENKRGDTNEEDYALAIKNKKIKK